MTGFIVHDADGVIHGIGMTKELAWSDMLDVMKQANVTVLYGNTDECEDVGSWTRADEMKIVPASGILMTSVTSVGGNVRWEMRDGIARDAKET